MNILFVTNFYPPHDLGGYEQWCAEVAASLRGRGHAVNILTSRHGVGVSDNAIGTVTRRLLLDAPLQRYSIVQFFLFYRIRQWLNRHLIRSSVRRLQPDAAVVWGMWNMSQCVTAALQSLMGDRVFYYLASYWPIEDDPHTWFWSREPKSSVRRALMVGLRKVAALNLADRRKCQPHLENVAACSDYVLEAVRARRSLGHGARVLYGGIDVSEFEPPSARSYAAPLRLLYFGGLYDHKGVDIAIAALGQVVAVSGLEGTTLSIVGGGTADYIAELRRGVDRYGLAERVRFVSRVERRDIPGILADHDVYLFTSRWPEPMARTMMEAMAAGLAVVGASVGGQVELMRHGENALVVPPNDPDGLAAAVVLLSQDALLAQSLSWQGRADVLSHYTLDRMTHDIEAWLCGS